MREFHRLPTGIPFPESLGSELRLRLQRVIHDSIRRASERRGEGERVELPAPGRAEPMSERLARGRVDGERGTYAVPSYGMGGALTALPLRDTAGGGAGQAPLARWPHPRGEVAEDQVVEGRSPLADQPVFFGADGPVRVRGERYAASGNLARAVTWGRLLFGGRPYAIVEGPSGSDAPRYLSVETGALPQSAPSAGGMREREVLSVKERFVWQPHLRGDGGSPYLLRGVVAGGGEVLWPPNRDLVQEFYDELESGEPGERHLPEDVACRSIFGEIDRLLAAGMRGEAAVRLAGLDCAAFSLLQWERKAEYLELLIDPALGPAGEQGSVEILKSLRQDEMERALDLLRWKSQGSEAGAPPKRVGMPAQRGTFSEEDSESMPTSVDLSK